MKMDVVGRRVLSFCVVLAAFIGLGAETTDTENYVLTEDKAVVVATGDTLVMSGVISGTGKIVLSGGGTLALSNPANTFSGGVTVSKGIIRADGAGTLGTGKILLTPAADTDLCQVYFAVAGTYANDIEQQGDSVSNWSSSSESYARMVVYKSGTFVFNGNITSSGHFFIRPQPANTGNASGTGAAITINGDISAPGKTVTLAYYGTPVINGKLTCATFSSIDSWSNGGTVVLANSGNSIGTVKVRDGVIRQSSAGALGGAALWICDAWDSGGHGVFSMGGCNASVASLSTAEGGSIPLGSSNCNAISSDGTPTLTITGASASKTSRLDIRNAINVMVDVDPALYPDFVQTFSKREISTTGALNVNRGQLKLTDVAAMRNVGSLTVGAGGTLTVESTTNNCLGGVSSLTVEGTLTTTRTDTFTDGLSLALGENAQLNLPAGSTLRVGMLLVNGTPVAPGTYTGVYGISGGSVEMVPGEYAINVPAGATNTVDMLFTDAMITGIRKTGAGGLILSNTASTFSGGIDLDEGSLIVNGAETLGFGTGPVRINGTAAKVCQLSFLGNTTFTNDIVHAKSSEAYPGIFIATMKAVTFTGSITSTDNMYIWNDRNGSDSTGKGPTTVFEGPVTAAGKTLTLRTYGTMDFCDKIVCSTLTCTPNWSAMGKVLLRSGENEIALFEDYAPAVECHAENALAGTALHISTSSWNSGGPKMRMGGCSQSVASINSSGTTLSELVKASAPFHCVHDNGSATPLSLTLTGEATSRWTYAGIRDNISLVLDAENHPGFVQTFKGLSSSTIGNVVVKNGTLEIGGAVTFANVPRVEVDTNGTLRIVSTEAVFPGVTRLVVNGKLEVTTVKTPFTSSEITLELGPDAELTLPESMQLTFSSITVNGQPKAPGTFTSANLPQVKSGSLVAAAAGDLVWTAGGGENMSFATAANWNSGEASVLLASGAVGLKFAQAGARAELGDAYGITHLYFDAPGDFTLAGVNAAAGLTLGSMGVEIAAGALARTTAIEDLSFTVVDSQSWSVPTTNETLRFKDAFLADTALGTSLSVNGAGRVVFEGTNVLQGGVKMGVPSRSTAGFMAPTMKVTGLLATPGHVDQGSAGNNANSLYFDLDHDGYGIADAPWGLRLADAVIEKPVAINQQMGEICLASEPGTTNVLAGELAFTGGEWIRVELLNRSEVTFGGGIKSPNHGLRLFGVGTALIRDRPVVLKKYSGLNPTGSSTVDVGVTGNFFNSVCVGYDLGSPTVRFSVSEAMTNGLLVAGFNSGYLEALATHKLGSGTYTVDLAGGTTQRCEKAAMSSRAVLKGQYPAMLEVYGDLPFTTDEEREYRIAGKVQDGVGVAMRGTGTLQLSGGNLTSCGDLAVSSGTLELAEGTTWLNGRKAYVSGTGTLKVNAGDAFAPGKMDIYVSGDAWKLDIPEGQTLAVHSLVDVATGRIYASGDYGNAVSGAANQSLAAHFVGNGRLHVRRGGACIIFK